MATNYTAPSPLMAQFVLGEYYTFWETVFSLAKSITSAKRLRKDFAPFNDCLKQAKSLMFEESMSKTDELISQGRLAGYDVETKAGINCTVHYTTGRFGKQSLKKLYGIEELPVLHNSMRLALLIMREAHSGPDSTNHWRSPSDIIGRAWSFALVYKPYKLALYVSKSCPHCILDQAKQRTVQQKIGQLDPNCLSPSPLFSDGPFGWLVHSNSNTGRGKLGF